MRLSSALFALGALAPVCAAAQLTTRTPLKAPPSGQVSAGVAVINPALVQAFRSGLQVRTTAPVATSGPNPLYGVVLTWPAYPGASGYQVLRQAVAVSGAAFAPVVIPVSGSATTYTVQNLPPFANDSSSWYGSLQFRVVAMRLGQAADTTAVVRAPTPAYMIKGDDHRYMMTSNDWPPFTTPKFAGIGYRLCQDMGMSLKLVWTRNPAATSYTVQLAQETSNGFSPLPPQSVTDTTITITPPAGAYRAFVRPEFAVPNWPTSGQNFTVQGAWTFFGTSHTPTPMSVPLPCPHY